MRIYARRPRGQTRILESRMSDGNVENFVARWEITPIDEGRTMVVFKLLLDPDLPIPSSIVTNENVVTTTEQVGNSARLDAFLAVFDGETVQEAA